MFLASLKLLNFKNYTAGMFSFNRKFVLLNGKNGSGKTNLIDAIYYLCICRSYFSRSDNLSPNHDSNFFRLDGEFKNGDEGFLITCKFQQNKKEFFKNNAPYDKLSEHIGLIPVVMVAPDDVSIINDGSEERRRFLDTAISQLDHNYLVQLMTYNKVLQQRNAALRSFYEMGHVDDALIGVLNNQLSISGNIIHKKRKSFLVDFTNLFREYYLKLCGNSEMPGIEYESQLNENDFLHLLMNNVRSDYESERTNFGIHKDDLELKLDGFILRETGSQGQIKSFLIALKLAQYQMILNTTGRKPVVLLDDIFEKLDKDRLGVLFAILNTDSFEQVFVTDADESRSGHFFNDAGIDYDQMLIGEQNNH